MSGIRGAIMSAISEFGQRPLFWTKLCVLYVVWINFSCFLRQLDCVSANWFLLIVIQLVDFVVYAGLINIAYLASGKEECDLKDIIVKDNKLGRFLLTAVVLAIVASLLSFMLVHSRGFTAALLGILMLLAVFLLFIKFSFVPFYILGESSGIVASIAQSWTLSDCRVILTLILYFGAMVIVILPFSLIDMLLVPYHISVVSFATPPGLLVLGYMYRQAAHKI